MRAVFIGECMVELRPAGDGLYGLGFAGDVYNAAVSFKRAAGDAEVQFLTVTGDEEISAQMRAAWASRRIGHQLAFRRPGTPGLYLIELEKGERRFHYWRSASPARLWLEVLLEEGGAARLAGADVVYLSGISLAILPDEQRMAAVELLDALKGRVGRIALDPNLRPQLWPSLGRARQVIGAAARVCDVVLPSREDLEGLGWSDLDLQGEVVVTAGAEGCRLRDGDGWISLPAPASSVRDTSGAGDAFHGVYLAARLQGRDPAEAARAGLAAAAEIVAVPGALPPLER